MLVGGRRGVGNATPLRSLPRGMSESSCWSLLDREGSGQIRAIVGIVGDSSLTLFQPLSSSRSGRFQVGTRNADKGIVNPRSSSVSGKAKKSIPSVEKALG